ncbi:hypothetical protein TUBRATIS_22270 [Tubulinosema ratisbonensis]|uniref:Uncharacterized protein n=1 Tax=Tubulinosema ratisbonensis TaxID=291195 RepID=A0A437AJG1_9MICR|nr:hypothetical protein TUBRATIS_22270 [Tubulinosema ratisbonensis]
MQLKKIENNYFTLLLHLSNQTDKISFNQCIEIKSNSLLPPKLLFFTQKENKLFSKIKIKTFTNTLKIIELNFKKQLSYRKICSFLKKYLPTIFDRKIIYQMNNEIDLKEYNEFLFLGLKEILNENEFNFYKEKFGKEEEEFSFGEESSIIESMSDICSEELINI